jgi:hypothetical protein
MAAIFAAIVTMLAAVGVFYFWTDNQKLQGTLVDADERTELAQGDIDRLEAQLADANAVLKELRPAVKSLRTEATVAQEDLLTSEATTARLEAADRKPWKLAPGGLVDLIGDNRDARIFVRRVGERRDPPFIEDEEMEQLAKERLRSRGWTEVGDPEAGKPHFVFRYLVAQDPTLENALRLEWSIELRIAMKIPGKNMQLQPYPIVFSLREAKLFSKAQGSITQESETLLNKILDRLQQQLDLPSPSTEPAAADAVNESEESSSDDSEDESAPDDREASTEEPGD